MVLELLVNALAQLRDVAHRLVMMHERLGGVWSLRARVVGTDEGQDPIGLPTNDFAEPNQAVRRGVTTHGTDGY